MPVEGRVLEEQARRVGEELVRRRPVLGQAASPERLANLVGGLAGRDSALRQRAEEVRDPVDDVVPEAAELLRVELDGCLPVGPSSPGQRAAGLTAPPIGSTLTALVLYSGVPMSGSPTSCVSQFTFASAKWSAIQTSPG